jgi:hypothetical protein
MPPVHKRLHILLDTTVELARIYNVHPNTIVKWKAELMGHARRA